MRASYEEELAKILTFWSSLGIQRITVVHYDDEVGHQNFKTVGIFMDKAGKRSTGVKIKRNAAVGPETYDQIINSDPQIVVITTLFGPAAEIVKGLAKRNKPYMYSSLSFVGASQLAKAGGAEASGVSVASVVPLPTNTTIPIVKECDEAMRKIEGGKLTFTSLEACISAKVLVEAMRRAGKEVSRDSLYKGLQAIGTQDLGGYTVRFGQNDHHGSSFVDLTVISKTGGFKS